MASTKYSGLEEFLMKQREDEIQLTFSEIEALIGEKLPLSAFKHRPWWSNNPSNSVITNAWLNAGFKSEKVDMKGRRLVFRRVGGKSNRAAASIFTESAGEPPRSYHSTLRHPLFGALKGTIRIAPGTDLCKPADPEWGSE